MKYYLSVSFEDKEIVKKEGARFDGDNKSWYWEGENLPASLEEFWSGEYEE